MWQLLRTLAASPVPLSSTQLRAQGPEHLKTWSAGNNKNKCISPSRMEPLISRGLIEPYYNPNNPRQPKVIMYQVSDVGHKWLQDPSKEPPGRMYTKAMGHSHRVARTAPKVALSNSAMSNYTRVKDAPIYVPPAHTPARAGAMDAFRIPTREGDERRDYRPPVILSTLATKEVLWR
jgi:hypothetical protein